MDLCLSPPRPAPVFSGVPQYSPSRYRETALVVLLSVSLRTSRRALRTAFPASHVVMFLFHTNVRMVRICSQFRYFLQVSHVIASLYDSIKAYVDQSV